MIKQFYCYLAEIAAFILLLDSRYMYLHNDHMVDDAIIVSLIVLIFVVLLYKPINLILSFLFFPPWKKVEELPLTKNVILEYIITFVLCIVLFFAIRSNQDIISKLNLFIK